jgi:hypothetical protein
LDAYKRRYGVATQNKWLQGGIDVPLKSDRLYHYVKNLRKEILEITHACGYEHPTQMTMNDIDISMGDNNLTMPLVDAYKYNKVSVQFESMEKLETCQYLGKSNPTIKFG